MDLLFLLSGLLVCLMLFVGALVNWRYKRGYHLLLLSLFTVGYVGTNFILVDTKSIFLILCYVNVLLLLISLWLTVRKHSSEPRPKSQWVQTLFGYIGTILSGVVILGLFYYIESPFISKDNGIKLEECKYQTADDLSNACGVKFPEVKLVDAQTAGVFGQWCDYMDFVIVEKNGKKRLIKNIEQQIKNNEFCGWSKTKYGYEFFSQGPNTAGDYFTEITVSESPNDTIHVRYGWAR